MSNLGDVGSVILHYAKDIESINSLCTVELVNYEQTQIELYRRSYNLNNNIGESMDKTCDYEMVYYFILALKIWAVDINTLSQLSRSTAISNYEKRV